MILTIIIILIIVVLFGISVFYQIKNGSKCNCGNCNKNCSQRKKKEI